MPNNSQLSFLRANVPPAAFRFTTAAAAAETIATATAATAVEASPAATLRAVLRGIDTQRPPIELLAVEARNRVGRFRFRIEGHESKPARAPRIAIGGEEDVLNLTGLCEKFSYLVGRGSEVEIADENLGTHSVSILAVLPLPECAGLGRIRAAECTATRGKPEAAFSVSLQIMDHAQAAPSLADLATILYQPRPTMRRILDSGHDRWAIQIAFLAAVCVSVSDTDLRHLQDVYPSLTQWAVLALDALAIIAGGVVWVGLLFLMSWIVAAIAKLLGGSGTVADTRAALAWALVPAIWSVSYRIPIAIYKSRFHIRPNVDQKAVLLDFLANGGCAIAVVSLMLQLVFFGWFLFVASNGLAEAQQYSPWKGLGNLALALAAPVVLACAAVIAFHIT